jgi:Uma2 family endonuclease
MSSVVKILPYYTYEDYEQWEGKWELIDGMPYAMSPAPTPKHQLVANTLGALFYFALKNCRHCKVYQAIDYKITEDTIFQPDVSVICKEAKKKFIDFPPALVVEILSTSTALKDRYTKLPKYQQQGIPYYLMISQDTEETEVYMLVDGKYELQLKDKLFSYRFQFPDDCSATIDFGELWQ